jgi:hypothetical protein
MVWGLNACSISEEVKNSLKKTPDRRFEIKKGLPENVDRDARRAAVTKGLNDCTPTLAEACAIQSFVVV